MGRWMGRDPLGEGLLGISLFVFCGNRINQYFDYRGLADMVPGLEDISDLQNPCCCKICLYSAVDVKTAKREGRVNIGDGMTGHTWVALETNTSSDSKISLRKDELEKVGQLDPNKRMAVSDEPAIGVFSFGPDNSYPLERFANGVKGAYWSIAENEYIEVDKYVVSKKCWCLGEEKCDYVRRDLERSDLYPEKFSFGQYCTKTSVDFLSRHGINPPNGSGEVKLPRWLPRCVRKLKFPNPKDMYEQILANGGAIITKKGLAE